MSTEMELLERVVVGGDLTKLSSGERMNYYKAVCQSVGLNPLTRPLDYITLSGKLTLYANKEASAQLRTLHGVSIIRLDSKAVEGMWVVTAEAQDKDGRRDAAIGAVPIQGLQGEARANAMMKAETKAKRRVTLSLCGLGMLDESEIESIPASVVTTQEAVAHDGAGPTRGELLTELRALVPSYERRTGLLVQRFGAGQPTLAELADLIAEIRRGGEAAESSGVIEGGPPDA